MTRPPPRRSRPCAAEAHHLLSGMPVGHPTRGIVVGGSGTNLVRLTADEEADASDESDESEEGDGEAGADEDWLIDKIRIGRAIRLVMHHPSAELVETYGLRERRIVQMAAGASLIEATLDCYDLPHVETSDASLREGAILAWQRAGDAWRERLDELISGAPDRPAPEPRQRLSLVRRAEPHQRLHSTGAPGVTRRSAPAARRGAGRGHSRSAMPGPACPGPCARCRRRRG